jgi:hypothetical protein
MEVSVLLYDHLQVSGDSSEVSTTDVPTSVHSLQNVWTANYDHCMERGDSHKHADVLRFDLQQVSAKINTLKYGGSFVPTPQKIYIS